MVLANSSVQANIVDIWRAFEASTSFKSEKIGSVGIAICRPEANPKGPPHPDTQLINLLTIIVSTN